MLAPSIVLAACLAVGSSVIQDPTGENDIIEVVLDGEPIEGALVVPLDTEVMFAVLLDNTWESLDDVLLTTKEPLVTDARGRVTVERGGPERLGVFVAFEGYRGFHDPEKDEGPVILEPGVHVPVRVVNPSGQPLAGVLVHMESRVEGQVLGKVAVGRTGAKGEIQAPYYPWLVPNDGVELAVGLQVFGAKNEAVPFDPQQIPRRPLELVQPPTGRIRFVTVDEEEAPVARDGLLQVLAPKGVAVADHEAFRTVFIREGEGWLDAVALGQSFEFLANFEELAPDLIPLEGPTDPNQIVVTRIILGPPVVDPDEVALTATVLLPTGEAPVDDLIRLECHTASGFHTSHFSLESGPGGELFWRMDPQPFDASEWVLRMVVQRKAGTSFHAERIVEPLARGETLELGTIQLVPSDTSVEGIVVGPDGSPVSGAVIQFSRVEKFLPQGPSYLVKDLEWQERREDLGIKLASGSDGRFELQGREEQLFDHGDPLARAVSAGFGPSEWKAFQRGDHIRLELGEATHVEGRVLLGRGVKPRDVILEVTPRGVLPLDPLGRKLPSPGKDGSFVLGPVGDGLLDLHVWITPPGHQFLAEPVLTIEGIRGGEREARLSPLDLRDVVFAYEVEVVGPDGKPVPAPRFRFRANGVETIQFFVGTVGRKLNRVVTDSRPARVLVEAEGMRTTSVEVSQPSTRVEMEPGIPVEIRVTNQPDLGETGFLAVSCSKVPNSNTHAEGQLEPNGTGTVLLPAAGRYNVRFQFQKRVGALIWSGKISGFGKYEIEVRDQESPQVVEIEFDAETVRIFREEGGG